MPKQKGSLLIELAVVVAIVTLIAAGTVTWMAQQAEKTKVEGLAVSMLTIQQSLQSLLDTHAFELLQAAPFALEGVSNLYQPTLQELQQLGFLAPSFPLNDTIKIVLYKEGSCPGEYCHIHGLVYSQQPLLTKKQQVDMNATAQWQSAVKGAGLVVWAANPARFTGAQLLVEHQYLAAGLSFPVGTVALLASTVTMTEDMQVGRYLILPRTETLGTTCIVNGAVVRGDDNQGLMSCEQGKWLRPMSSTTSLEAYKNMIKDVWQITLPDDTPGGFFARERVHFSYHCWIPNPMQRYNGGRGQCLCPSEYRARKIGGGGSIRDDSFKNGIARPEIDIFICA